MSEVIKNVEVDEVEETMEETKEGFLTKAGGFMKKNGKKIAAGAAVIIGIGVVYTLGKNSVGTVSSDVVDTVTDTISDVADEVTDL